MKSRKLFILDLGLSAHESTTQNTGRILSCNLDGSNLGVVVDGINLPDGLAVDREGGHIYWTDMGRLPLKENDGSVLRCNLSDGSEVTTIIPPGATFTPKQIILASLSRKLYWCDREGMRVMRANLDGSAIEVLYQAGEGDMDRLDATRWCVGIAVDEIAGHIFFTHKGPSKGGRGRIIHMGIEIPKGQTASTRRDIRTLFENLPEPIDLVWDAHAQALFWTDRGDPPLGNTVNMATHQDGHWVRKVLGRKLHEAIGIDVDEVDGSLYVADLGGRVLRYCLDGSAPKLILHDMGDLTGVVVA
ncbi:hypothetical protein BDV24DRAFT_177016 [Aspergillus arachidicola]|uniref:Low density lipoprotein receptor n=1 Tax=Aspergillus arachidicola TaxID=656916 RepID=A0A5N6YMK7_9EURO|nr:hypothetical protein BDV24DRAFT_177016 [Aspergillus arachidicola]